MSRFLNFRILLLLSIALAAGIWSGMAHATGKLSAPLFWVICALAFAGALALALFCPASRKWGVGLCLCAAFAGIGFGLFGPALSREEAGRLPEGEYLLTGRVSDRQEGSLILDGAAADGLPIGRVQLFTEETAEIGTEVEAEVSLSPVPLMEDGGVNTYSVRTGVDYFAVSETVVKTGQSGDLLTSARAAIMRVFEENMHEDIWPLADALVLGNKTYVEESRMDNYRAAGIVHIFAISGLHVGFLTAAVFWAFGRLKLPYVVRLPVTALLLLGYAALCNFSPSVIRASLMACLLLLSKCLFQKYDLLNSLSTAWLLILLFQPLFLFDAGFLMSFSTILGIGLLSGGLQRALRFLPGFLRSGVAVSVSAQIGITPVMLIYFRSLPIWSVFANLLAIPLVTVCYLALMIALLLTLILPWLGFLLAAPQVLFEVIDFVAMLFASLPGWGILLLPMGAGALIYYAAAVSASDKLFLRRAARALLCGFLCFAFAGCYLFAYTPAQVGQDLYLLAADSPLFVAESEGKRLLIDLSTGENDYEDLDFLLRKFRIARLDGVVAPREGNSFLMLARALDGLSPERFFLAPSMAEENTAQRDFLRAQGAEVVELEGDRLELFGLRMTFYGEDRSVLRLESADLTAFLECGGEEEAKREATAQVQPPADLLFSEDERLREGLAPAVWIKTEGKERGEGQIYSLSYLGSLIFRAGYVIIS